MITSPRRPAADRLRHLARIALAFACAAAVVNEARQSNSKAYAAQEKDKGQAAEPPKENGKSAKPPRKEGSHAEFGVDDLLAFFQKGINPRRKGDKIPGQHNKVYTVGELFTKFGRPEKRADNPRYSSLAAGRAEEQWVYECKDGVLTVEFVKVAFAAATSKEEGLRLRILGVSTKRTN